MSENIVKRGPGRPPKESIAYDSEAVKEFVEGEYQFHVEKKQAQESHKDFRDAFKERIDAQLIAQIIRAVKLKAQMEKRNASQETVESIMDIVEDIFGATLSREALDS